MYLRQVFLGSEKNLYEPSFFFLLLLLLSSFFFFFLLSFSSYHFQSISLTFFWHFLTFFQKNFKFLKQCQICHSINIWLSNVHHWSQMYIFWHFFTLKKIQIFKKHAKFATKWKFCSQMYISALRCTFFDIFWHLKKN